MLYVCDTLTSAYAASDSFGITAAGSMLADRGMVGFNQPIVMYAWDEEEGAIDESVSIRDHSTWVIGRLQSGDKLSDAVNDANTKFPVYKFKIGTDLVPASTPAIIRGDGNTRMHNVYGGPNNWFMSSL